MVGVTVLAALLAPGWMILKFAGMPIALLVSPRMTVHFVCERADGLGEGSNVTFRGMSVGQVTHLTRLENETIRVDAVVEDKPPLPANVTGVIRSTGLLGGGSAIQLALTGPTGQEVLEKNQEIPATYVGLDILPPEFAELATELRLTARQFRESNVVLHMDEQVQHLGKVIDSVQGFIDDPKIRQDLKDSVANLRIATEKADKIGDNIDQFTQHLDQLSTETARLDPENPGAPGRHLQEHVRPPAPTGGVARSASADRHQDQHRQRNRGAVCERSEAV